MKRYQSVLILAFVWAAYYYSLGISNKLIDPFITGVVIRCFTFLVLGLWFVFSRKINLLIVKRRQLPLLLLIGCMGFLLDITAFWGSKLGNAATGSILLKTDVVMVALLSIFIEKKRFSLFQWAMTFIMLTGVAVVLGLTPGAMAFHPSDLLFLLSAFFVSVNAFLIKAAQRQGVANLVIAYYNNNMTLVLFVICVLVTGTGGQFALIGHSPSLVSALLVGAAGQFFVYIFYYDSLKKLPVWNVKTILLLIPIITLLYDFCLKGSVPTPQMVMGAMVVLISAAIILFIEQKSSKEASIH